MQICKNITDLLSKNGWSQSKLAEMSGLKQASISRYVAGKTEPKVSDALKIAEAFKVSLEYLLSGVDAEWDAGSTFYEEGKKAAYAEMERLAVSNSITEGAGSYRMSSHGDRMVPVIGMAHAGVACDYDEIDMASADLVPTMCPDPKAFALDIEGDSMYPLIADGDNVVVMPGRKAHNGCIVVARLKEGGVVCRKVEQVGKTVKLIPVNKEYDSSDHTSEDFFWIYPLWGSWRQFWRGE